MNIEETHYNINALSSPVVSKTTIARMRRYVNFAKTMFSRGACSHGRTMNFCFAAHKSKLIVVGQNDYRRLMTGYIKQFKGPYKKIGEESYKPGLHAEMSALLRLGLEDCSHLDFYVVRLDRQSHCCYSIPCANCLAMLRQVGYKHLYFYDKNMNICEFKRRQQANNL